MQAGQQVLAYAKKEEEGVLADRVCQQAVAGTRLLAITLMLPLAALCLRPIVHAGAWDSKDQPLLCILKINANQLSACAVLHFFSIIIFPSHLPREQGSTCTPTHSSTYQNEMKGILQH